MEQKNLLSVGSETPVISCPFPSLRNLGSLGSIRLVTPSKLRFLDTIKGWEFGDKVRMVCANVDNQFYAIQGSCPRCAFDLWKGDLLTDKDVWENAPCVACPTCSTTFGLRNGAYGPPLKRSGLAGFVTGLAATSTNADAFKNAKAFRITRDLDGRVYCRDI